jgi:hypothetical protein
MSRSPEPLQHKGFGCPWAPGEGLEPSTFGLATGTARKLVHRNPYGTRDSVGARQAAMSLPFRAAAQKSVACTGTENLTACTGVSGGFFVVVGPPDREISHPETGSARFVDDAPNPGERFGSLGVRRVAAGAGPGKPGHLNSFHLPASMQKSNGL